MIMRLPNTSLTHCPHTLSEKSQVRPNWKKGWERLIHPAILLDTKVFLLKLRVAWSALVEMRYQMEEP